MEIEIDLHKRDIKGNILLILQLEISINVSLNRNRGITSLELILSSLKSHCVLA